MSVKIESPPIRACLFDMDGLLINTEDMYTLCANHVLAKYNRPPLPWSIKAKLMGVPGGSTSSVFIDWAQLPISKEQYALEQREQQKLHFPSCKPLPGVEKLLKDLSTARDVEGNKVHIALATSSEKYNFGLKTSKEETRRLLEVFGEGRRVLGDDPRVEKGRGKPAPDIYLLALKLINESLAENEEPIRPEECLVFEDSVPGVEAGRRAGMKVVWVPHEGLLAEYKGQEEKVLAGRMGMRIGDEEQLGQIDDGWGQLLPNLEDFPYETYGIVVS
ncbi:putative haloacid dehalogenase-like hydrolase protein [Botrytis cinerea BcDW1]|uniref:Putative haloacid dehalogenase-like hydrolase protein n=1 Tax=Botryotinia fuckeliana (strain BcDW1) TaxID=1290391 RepID=M7TRL0_BOTF1|nr:putative haloacid dehalogenase-like hydrolase protein [Botrytis cinerea BcDW1]